MKIGDIVVIHDGWDTAFMPSVGYIDGTKGELYTITFIAFINHTCCHFLGMSDFGFYKKHLRIPTINDLLLMNYFSSKDLPIIRDFLRSLVQ